MSTQLLNFYTIFLEGKKTICLIILSSYHLASETEAFFSDRHFCMWQNFFSSVFCYRNFFLWYKFDSLVATWTKTCFCDGNLFSELTFSLTEFFCLTETCFCKINLFFILSKVCFCHGILSVTLAWFCDRNLFCQKYNYF